MKYANANPRARSLKAVAIHSYVAPEDIVPMPPIWDHLLPLFRKFSDGEQVVIYKNGDYRWLCVEQWRNKAGKPKAATFTYASKINQTSKKCNKTKKPEGLMDELAKEKDVAALIWTSISSDVLTHFCEFLKKKPTIAKQFMAAKTVGQMTQVLVDNYKALTVSYPISFFANSKKERTWKAPRVRSNPSFDDSYTTLMTMQAASQAQAMSSLPVVPSSDISSGAYSSSAPRRSSIPANYREPTAAESEAYWKERMQEVEQIKREQAARAAARQAEEKRQAEEAAKPWWKRVLGN